MSGSSPTGPRDRRDDPPAIALRDGMAALDEHALVAMVLGPGRGRTAPQPLAARVIEHVGSLGGLGRFGPGGLGAVAGLGRTRALRLAAAVELGRRLGLRATCPGRSLANARAVAEFLAPRLGRRDEEQMWVLSLDGQNQLRGSRCVAQGGVHSLAVSPADILRAALCDAAAGFVLAHNHPSGCPRPSEQDVDTTARVATVADALGVPLLDHVIVTPAGDFASLLELGLLPRAPPARALAAAARATARRRSAGARP
jgi:DNA repair protein RadC